MQERARRSAAAGDADKAEGARSAVAEARPPMARRDPRTSGPGPRRRRQRQHKGDTTAATNNLRWGSNSSAAAEAPAAPASTAAPPQRRHFPARPSRWRRSDVLAKCHEAGVRHVVSLQAPMGTGAPPLRSSRRYGARLGFHDTGAARATQRGARALKRSLGVVSPRLVRASPLRSASMSTVSAESRKLGATAAHAPRCYGHEVPRKARCAPNGRQRR